MPDLPSSHSELTDLLLQAREYVAAKARYDHSQSLWGPARNLLNRIDEALGREPLPDQPPDWPEPKLPPRTIEEVNRRA